MIIGQAQGERWKLQPFPRSKLWAWLDTIGWTTDDVLRTTHFDALINTGTAKAKKGRVPPTGAQIAQYRPQLIATIDRIKPRLIIPVGGLAVQRCLDKTVELADVVGGRFIAKPFGAAKRETVIIPLPHPSGVSLWLNSEPNKKLLKKALVFIQKEIAAIA